MEIADYKKDKEEFFGMMENLALSRPELKFTDEQKEAVMNVLDGLWMIYSCRGNVMCGWKEASVCNLNSMCWKHKHDCGFIATDMGRRVEAIMWLKYVGYSVINAHAPYAVLDSPMANCGINVIKTSAYFNCNDPWWKEMHLESDCPFVNCGSNIEIFKAVSAMRLDRITVWKKVVDGNISEILHSDRIDETKNGYEEATVEDIISFFGGIGEPIGWEDVERKYESEKHLKY